MPLTLNAGIDFDLTLVNKNVNNAIVKELNKKRFPDGTTDSNQAQSAINSADMSEEVKQWLDGVIHSNGIEFFNKELLQDLLLDFRKLGCQPFILTASYFPGAAKYMLKKIGQTDLADNVHSVPAEGAPQNKANYLRNLEEKAYKRGAKSVATVFIDDSTNNIAAVNNLTKKDTTERCIVKVGTKGLDIHAYQIVKDFADEVMRKEREAKRGSVCAIEPEALEGAIKEEANRGTMFINNPEAIEEAIKEEANRGTVFINNQEAIEEAIKEEAIKEEAIKEEARKVTKEKRRGMYVTDPESIQEAIKEEARKEEARKMREPIDEITTSGDDQTQNSSVSIRRKGNRTEQPPSFEGAPSAVSSKLNLSSPAGGSTNWSALREPQVVDKTQKKPSGNTQNQNVNSKPNIERKGGIRRK